MADDNQKIEGQEVGIRDLPEDVVPIPADETKDEDTKQDMQHTDSEQENQDGQDVQDGQDNIEDKGDAEDGGEDDSEDIDDDALVASLKQLAEERGVSLDDTDGVKDIVSAVAESLLEEKLEKLPEPLRDAVKAIEEGEDPHEVLKTITGHSDDVPEVVSEDDEEAKANIIRKALQIEGFSEDEIEQEIEELKKEGNLDHAFKMHYRRLKKIQKRLEEEQRRQQEEQINQAKKQIRSVLKEKREVQGVKFSDYEINQLPSYLFDASVEVNGIKMTPFTRDLLSLYQQPDKLALIAKIVRHKGDLSILAKHIQSQAVEKVKGAIKNRSGRPRGNRSTSVQGSAGRLADIFPGIK